MGRPPCCEKFNRWGWEAGHGGRQRPVRVAAGRQPARLDVRPELVGIANDRGYQVRVPFDAEDVP